MYLACFFWPKYASQCNTNCVAAIDLNFQTLSSCSSAAAVQEWCSPCSSAPLSVWSAVWSAATDCIRWLSAENRQAPGCSACNQPWQSNRHCLLWAAPPTNAQVVRAKQGTHDQVTYLASGCLYTVSCTCFDPCIAFMCQHCLDIVWWTLLLPYCTAGDLLLLEQPGSVKCPTALSSACLSMCKANLPDRMVQEAVCTSAGSLVEVSMHQDHSLACYTFASVQPATPCILAGLHILAGNQRRKRVWHFADAAVMRSMPTQSSK